MPSPIHSHIYVCSIVYMCKYCVCPHEWYGLLDFGEKKHYIYQSISEKGVVRVITNDGSIVILCIGIMRWPTNLHLTTKHTF